MSPNRADRPAVVVALVASVILLCPLAWPIISGQNFSRDDLGRFHLPVRAFYSHCLSEGDSPLWHPGLYCGLYLHGEGQGGFDHPLHLLIYRYLPLSSAFAIEVFSGYPLMFFGMILWLRRAGLETFPAIFGAMSLTFSEFLVLRYVHMNAIEVLAHLPWALLAIEMAPRRSGSLLGLALLTASQGLLGYPQYFALCLLIEGSYTLVRHGRSPRTLCLLMTSVLVGLVMASAQLLPHLDALAASNRASPTASFLGMNSLHPWNLISIFVPVAFRQGWYNPDGPASWPRHESVAHLGVFFPWFVAWLWIRRAEPGRLKALEVWVACIGIAALVLSLGRFMPGFPVYAKLPIARVFRGPARYMVIAQFAASVLSAFAIAELASLKERLSWRTLLPLFWVLGLSIVLVGVLTFVPQNKRGQVGGSREMSVSLAWILGSFSLVVARVRGVSASNPVIRTLSRVSPLVIVVVLALDSWTHNVTPVIQHERGPSLLAENCPQTSDRLVSSENIGLMSSSKLVGGYVALTPRKLLDYSRLKALQLAGAAWRLDDSGNWSRLADEPFPRVRLVSRILVSSDPGRDLETIDPSRVVLVESKLEIGAGSGGVAQIVLDRPGRIDIRTDSGFRQVLVVSESYHPGWNATRDGRPVEVLRVNGDFLGCPVEPGNHEFQLRFEPTSARVGRAISIISFCVVLVLFAAVRILVVWNPNLEKLRSPSFVLDFEVGIR